jgi:hypothetical protein
MDFNQKEEYNNQTGGIIMSNREYCQTLLESFTDVQLAAVAEYMERLKQAEEDEDMDFCVALYDEAKRADDGYSISEERLRQKYEL